MEIVDKEKFDEAIDLPEVNKIENAPLVITPDDFKKVLVSLENPVDLQKELAVKVKLFLDARIETELQKNGVLTEYTRMWVRDFNDILDKIQRALYGDKRVNLHLHKVSHSHIAAKIREHRVKVINDGTTD